MKIYMSYWCGGYQKTPSELVLNMHKLAANYAVKHYGEVTLITDSKSKELFETEDSPFTSITTDLDVFDGLKNKNWAIGKLYAYNMLAKRKEPFLHIDYDVFLLNPIRADYEESKVLVQSTETNVLKKYGLKQFYDNIGENTAGFTEPQEEDEAYNMGIFGGIEYDFIEEYSQNSIDFCLNPKNEKTLDIMYKHQTWAPACISEQYYLWAFAKKCGIEVSQYLSPGCDRTIEGQMLMEIEAGKKGYVHLQGAKKHKGVDVRIKELLAEFSNKEKVNV